MEIYTLLCHDFNGFCLKWDSVLKIKPQALYKVTVSAGVPLAEPCKWRKFGSATAMRSCSGKSTKHIPKKQRGTLYERLQGCPGQDKPMAS